MEFFADNGGSRMDAYPPQPPMEAEPGDDSGAPDEVTLDREIPAELWQPIPVAPLVGCDIPSWPARPVRFIDGKDVGDTVAWLLAPAGYPVPVRLGEIGATAVRVEEGVCRRESVVIEKVVAMYVDGFPWDEVEDLAGALQTRGYRLLPAVAPWDEAAQARRPSFNFEVMRKSAQNRSNTEMGTLEEATLGQASDVPTVVDGRLEPRVGGFDRKFSPVVGVIKTHSRLYLHERGLTTLYSLGPGERTPIFALERANLPVVSWYVKLAGAVGTMPTWGAIRVELSLAWFDALPPGTDLEHVGRLSLFLCEYRCRSSAYARAPVSLHPIVRAEELLGALFTSPSTLAQRFYRLAGL